MKPKLEYHTLARTDVVETAQGAPVIADWQPAATINYFGYLSWRCQMIKTLTVNGTKLIDKGEVLAEQLDPIQWILPGFPRLTNSSICPLYNPYYPIRIWTILREYPSVCSILYAQKTIWCFIYIVLLFPVKINSLECPPIFIERCRGTIYDWYIILGNSPTAARKKKKKSIVEYGPDFHQEQDKNGNCFSGVLEKDSERCDELLDSLIFLGHLLLLFS